MKKLLMLVGVIALFVGCGPEVVYLDKDGQPVQPPPDHMKILWQEDYICCCEIEGHRYFVGMASGYSIVMAVAWIGVVILCWTKRN